MTPERLMERLEVVAGAEGGIARLRRLVLELGLTGRLGTGSPDDEPVQALLERVADEMTAQTSLRGHSEASGSARPELPQGWLVVRMGEIVDQRLGKMLDEHKNKGQPRPYLRNSNVQWFRFELSDVGEMRIEASEIDEFQVLAGDLLVCEGGEPGRAAVWRGERAEMFFQKAIHRLRPRGGISSDFLALRLRLDTWSETLDALFTGATIKHLTGRALAAYSFALPPVPEQHRIVARVNQLMAMLDELEQRQDEQRAAAIRVGQASLDALMHAEDEDQRALAWTRVSESFGLISRTDGGVERARDLVRSLAISGRLLPSDAGAEPLETIMRRVRAQRDRLGVETPAFEAEPPQALFTAPPSWHWVRLGDLVLDSEAGRSPQCESHPREGSEWGVLKVSAVSWGAFLPRENKALPAGSTPDVRWEVQDGDFLLSRANTAELVARSVIARDPPPHLLLSDKLVRMRLCSDADPRFVNLYNNGRWARTYYAGNATGTSDSMKNVSRRTMLELPIALPPLPEQRRIMDRVDALMLAIDALERSLAAQARVASLLANARGGWANAEPPAVASSA